MIALYLARTNPMTQFLLFLENMKFLASNDQLPYMQTNLCGKSIQEHTARLI
jgi:hypothetical protein